MNVLKQDKARTRLEAYASMRDAVFSKGRLLELIKEAGETTDPAYVEIERTLISDKKVLKELEIEIISTISRLQDGPGKTALLMHYVYGCQYKALAIDLQLSERQLMRKINTALEQLTSIVTSVMEESHDD